MVGRGLGEKEGRLLGGMSELSRVCPLFAESGLLPPSPSPSRLVPVCMLSNEG